jgi:hypothetical protein
MQKNTISTTISNMEAITPASSNSPKKGGKKKVAGPSKQTIENILNFSKALRVEPKADGETFIEYLAN